MNTHHTAMALNIRNPEADRLANELAELTGKTKTDAVIHALRETLQRARTQRAVLPLRDRIAVIARRCSQLPVLDGRSAEEVLGYDESGLP